MSVYMNVNKLVDHLRESGLDGLGILQPKARKTNGIIKRNGKSVIDKKYIYQNNIDQIIYVTRENVEKLLKRDIFPEEFKKEIIYNLNELDDENGVIPINISKLLDKKFGKK